MNRPSPGGVDIQDVFERGTPIDEAMNQAVREAVLAHRRAGVPLIVWRDGRVQAVSPDEIEGETAAPSSSDEKTRPTTR